VLIPRLLSDAVRVVDPGPWLNRGAVRNAAAAVARDADHARLREDTRRAVDRANLSAHLMRLTAG
jgi:hypothetical protein